MDRSPGRPHTKANRARYAIDRRVQRIGKAKRRWTTGTIDMGRHAWILILAQCCFFAYVYAAAPLSTQNIADRVGFAQHLSAVVPSDLRFRDETGRAVSIGDYRGTTPIVLVFSYFGCSTLCPTFIAHLVQMLEQTDLTPGRQYMVLVVSIDPHDSPALAHSKKAVYFEQATQRNNAGAWHLLTGSHGDIASLTAAAGFRYFFDVDSHQYAHPPSNACHHPSNACFFCAFISTR